MAYLYARVIIPKFETYLECGKLVLDIGCGKGGLAAIVRTIPEKNLNPTIIGIDLELKMLKVAKPFYDGVVLCSACYLPFRRTFDAVFSIEVIEHLDEKHGHRHISEVERVSQGLVAITTPSHFFLPDITEGSFQIKELMRHKSFWSAKYFSKRGYVVEGLYPARDWIPPLLAKKSSYLACSTLAYKVLFVEA